MNKPPVFIMENVRKRFSWGSASFELQIPRFEAFAGDFVAVLGSSGCGKSSFLDLIGLVRSPDHCDRMELISATSQCFDLSDPGESLRARIRREHIGYLLQDGGLMSFLSGRDNLALTRVLAGLTGSLEPCRSMLNHLGLTDHLERKPSFLSGGQRQRMGLARALAHRPLLLLADEPTAAVDKLTARDIVEELLCLAREEQTLVIMVTHDRSLVEDRADCVVTFDLSRPREDQTLSVVSAKRRT